MGDILIIFVFVGASVIFFLGMILVISNKLELETDNAKEKKLLNSLYGAIFMIVITISIPILTCFFGTDDNSGQYQTSERRAVVTDQQTAQQNTPTKEDSITLKYIAVFGITAFLDMILLVPTILLINMFREELEKNRKKRLLRDAYFIISLVILLNIVIVFICLAFSL